MSAVVLTKSKLPKKVRTNPDSPKSRAKYLINHLPDDVTWEQIQYHVYVLTEIAKGEAQIEDGRGVSHEDAKRRFAQWLK